MKNDETFKLRLPADELTEWRQRAEAADLSLAAWIRERCNDPVTGVRTADSVQRVPARVLASKRAEREADVPLHNPDSAADLRCPHRKRRGELCYKCDQKFGLPNIE